MIISICGKSGSGKSTLSRKIVEKCDAIYVDIDKIGHKVLTFDEVINLLKCSFGENFVNDGVIDRKKLGDVVFNSRSKMKVLSDITWKYIEIEIDKVIEENKNCVIVLDWILLPITKYFKMSDMRILLDVPYEIRRDRAIKRDGITSDDFDAREKASIDFNQDDFDYVIRDNNDEFIKGMVKLL